MMRVFVMFALLVLIGCGKFFPGSSPTLVSISVTPVIAAIHPATTKQFVASGTFSDGSRGDVSGSVAWSSSDTGIATVNASGLATAGATGIAVITATKDSVSGIAALTVN